MKKLRSILLLVLCFTLLVPSLTVYADGICKQCQSTPSTGLGAYGYCSDCLKEKGYTDTDIKLISSFGMSSLAMDFFPKLKSCAILAKAQGYSDESIAGMLAYIYSVSSFNTGMDTTIEKGLLGLSDITEYINSSYHSSCNHDKVQLSGGTAICKEGTCQFLYFLSQIESNQKIRQSNLTDVSGKLYHGSSVTNLQTYVPTALDDLGGKNFDYAKLGRVHMFYKDLKSSTMPAVAAQTYFAIFSDANHPANNIAFCKLGLDKIDYSDSSKWNTQLTYGANTRTAIKWFTLEWYPVTGSHRLSIASHFNDWIKSSDLSSSLSDESKSDLNGIVNNLVNSGIYSEEDLASFCQLTEQDIENVLKGAIRDNLDKDKLDTLVDWENNLEQNKNEDGWISMLRKFVMFIGIVFTVWIMLIYLAYWFDRLNNFFYLDLLSILTFGQLHMSDTESECTFHVKDLGKGGTKTVNHRAILFICIVGIVFGTLLISGVFYGLIAGLVNTVLGWLS